VNKLKIGSLPSKPTIANESPRDICQLIPDPKDFPDIPSVQGLTVTEPVDIPKCKPYRSHMKTDNGTAVLTRRRKITWKQYYHLSKLKLKKENLGTSWLVTLKLELDPHKTTINANTFMLPSSSIIEAPSRVYYGKSKLRNLGISEDLPGFDLLIGTGASTQDMDIISFLETVSYLTPDGDLIISKPSARKIKISFVSWSSETSLLISIKKGLKPLRKRKKENSMIYSWICERCLIKERMKNVFSSSRETLSSMAKE
jgi:hypothetical protein